MIVRLSDQAEADLEAIGDFIAADNPYRAVSYTDELLTRCMSLSDLPRGSPLVQGLEQRGIRRRRHDRYGIFYIIEADRIQVLRILHAARDHVRLLRDG